MNRLIMITIIAITSCSAYAASPLMGGSMSHILVTLFEQQVYLSFESPSMSTVQMQNYDESYDGAAGVLNDTGYNSQFGWMANGFISLPPESGIFVRKVHSSPWLNAYSESGYEPILGTEGSSQLWQWDGTMTHNWYSSMVKGGTHSVLYEVFVGDLAGQPLLGYAGGQIQLNFEYGEKPVALNYSTGDVLNVLPAPASGGVLVCGMLMAFSRRR
jgi:hypothetical protein